jgi:hypothetical protein
LASVSYKKVSVRLAGISVLSGGRKMILDSAEGVSGKYRSSALKKTYAFNEKGEVVTALLFLIFPRVPCALIIILRSPFGI